MSYTPQSTGSFLDLVKPETSSPSTSPRFTLHRIVEDAIDSGSITDSHKGMNMAGYDTAVIQVVPKTTSGSPAPDIEVLSWSEEAGQFVSASTPRTANAPAANTPYEYTCDVFGGVIFVYVTGTLAAGDSAEIYIAGAELDHNS